MKRRRFIKQVAFAAAGMSLSREPWFTAKADTGTADSQKLDPMLAPNWLKPWEEHILGVASVGCYEVRGANCPDRFGYCAPESERELSQLAALRQAKAL